MAGVPRSGGDTCAEGTDAQGKASDRKVNFYVFFGNESTEIKDYCLENADQ